MKSKKIILILIILVIILGIGYMIISFNDWEKEDMVKGDIVKNNLGEGGGYRIQILEKGAG